MSRRLLLASYLQRQGSFHKRRSTRYSGRRRTFHVLIVVLQEAKTRKDDVQHSSEATLTIHVEMVHSRNFGGMCSVAHPSWSTSSSPSQQPRTFSMETLTSSLDMELPLDTTYAEIGHAYAEETCREYCSGTYDATSAGTCWGQHRDNLVWRNAARIFANRLLRYQLCWRRTLTTSRREVESIMERHYTNSPRSSTCEVHNALAG